MDWICFRSIKNWVSWMNVQTKDAVWCDLTVQTLLPIYSVWNVNCSEQRWHVRMLWRTATNGSELLNIIWDTHWQIDFTLTFYTFASTFTCSKPIKKPLPHLHVPLYTFSALHNNWTNRVTCLNTPTTSLFPCLFGPSTVCLLRFACFDLYLLVSL